MKLILSILFSFLILSTYGQSSPTHDLKITLTNVKNAKGNIKLGLFNEAKTFLGEGKEYRTITKKVASNEVIIVLKNIPKGVYAFALYHDVNSDEICNTNFIGIPTEPYAFSNNFKPKFSKPDFKDCKINVDGDERLTIKLID